MGSSNTPSQLDATETGISSSSSVVGQTGPSAALPFICDKISAWQETENLTCNIFLFLQGLYISGFLGDRYVSGHADMKYLTNKFHLAVCLFS